MRSILRVAPVAALMMGVGSAAAQDAPVVSAADRPPVRSAMADIGQEDTITVTGKRVANAQLGALGAKSTLDTPFSVTTFDAALIKDIQATTLTDLLKFEPGATVQLSDVNEGTQFLVRGFRVDQYYVDSVPGAAGGALEPPLELVENVQLLKGAAGFLYGFTSPGGILNLVTKRPKIAPFADIVAGYEQDSLFRVHLDTGTATTDGRFGIRLNLVGEDGRDRHLDTRVRRYAVGLNADAQLTPTTTLQLDLIHSRRRLFGNSFGFYVNDTDVPVPRPISGTSRLAPDFATYRDDSDSIAPSLIQQLGAGWTARLDTSWSRLRRNYHDSELDGLMANGDYTLGLYTFNSRTDTKAGQLLLSGGVKTSPLSHDLVFGAYYASATQRNARATADGCCITVGPGNIAAPVPDFADPGLDNPSLANGYKAGNILEKALFASDTVSLGSHWQALLGARYVWRTQRSYLDGGAVSYHDDRHKLTPTAAFLWKPRPNITAYLSYAQSLQRGGTAPANAANAGDQLPPIASTQYEAGVKARLGGLLLTAAAFRIERGFEFLLRQSASLLPLYVQDGIQRHDGVEFAASGRIGSTWRVAGGVQLLDPRVREGDPSIRGNRPPAVPRYQAKGFIEYAPPVVPGAAVNLSISYASGSFLDPTNKQKLDGYVTFDLGARYRFAAQGTPLTVRASMGNIFARKYWLPTDALIPGEPRTIRVSLEAEF